MNDFITEITLDLNCKETPVVISAGQYDLNRKIIITITANGDVFSVDGCTAVCKGVDGNGKNHFAINCDVDNENNKIVLTTDETMFLSKGNTVARIVLSDGTRVYSTQRFIALVGAAFEGEITQTEAYSILNSLINRVIQITESGGIIVDEALDSDSKNPVSNSALTRIIQEKLNLKADKANTLSGYGITDAYIKDDVNKALSGKLSSSDSSVHFRHLNADVFADEIAGGNTMLVRSTTVYSALEKKADAEDVNSGLALKVNNTEVITEFDKLFSDPDKIPTVMAVMDYLNGYYYSAEETYSDSEINDKLAEKYDASNVETGSGQLSVEEAADTSVVKSAAFEYQRVGTIVNVFIKIVFNAGTGNYFSFSGLPYATASPLDLSNKHKYTTVTSKYQQTTVAPLHSRLAVFFNRTVTFAQDEELSFHICQKIK